jgi:hypothetical protein
MLWLQITKLYFPSSVTYIENISVNVVIKNCDKGINMTISLLAEYSLPTS